jgi:hypothetical protein
VPFLFSAFHGLRVHGLYVVCAYASFCCGVLLEDSRGKSPVVCLPAAVHNLRIHIVTCNYHDASMGEVNLLPPFDRDVDHIRGVLLVNPLF